MEIKRPAWRKYVYRSIALLVVFMCEFTLSNAQPPKTNYTVRDGNMVITISRDIEDKELDEFISQFELGALALGKFIRKGYADSVMLAGWHIAKNDHKGFVLTKPLLSADLSDPYLKVIDKTGKSPADNFPSVSNKVLFGYNRFRDTKSFSNSNGLISLWLKGYTNARRVFLAGSFSNWSPDSIRMKLTDSGWVASIRLTPGKYWYKFVIDGNWTIDPSNRYTENDENGNTNSVFFVTNHLFRLDGFTKAKKVVLAGSFNGWQESKVQLEKTATGWELPVYLANGTHTYRYIVDRDWITDPGNPDKFPNEFNDYNSFVAIGTPHIFKLEGYNNASRVVLSGSFNGWREDELYMRKTATGWELPYVLGNGNHEYKFIVDGKSVADPGNPSTSSKNSLLILGANYTFTLKGYENARAVYIAGDFNDWAPQSLALKKENGNWSIPVYLSRGKHLYKFIVDGNWIIDPGNKLWEQNQHNTGNSVIWID